MQGGRKLLEALTLQQIVGYATLPHPSTFRVISVTPSVHNRVPTTGVGEGLKTVLNSLCPPLSLLQDQFWLEKAELFLSTKPNSLFYIF